MYPDSKDAPTKAWFSMGCPDKDSNDLERGLGVPGKNGNPLRKRESPIITVST